MGIDTVLWRARIGTFIQPRKCRCFLQLSKRTGSIVLRLTLLFALLLLRSGAVETNPGPPKQNPKGVSTRQSTLAFSMPSNADRRASLSQDSSPVLHKDTQHDLFAFLHEMKKDLSCQNEQLMRDISSVNTKLDNVTKRIDSIQEENKHLKDQNEKMQKQIDGMTVAMDGLESQSRRNNVIIYGIEGNQNEDWAVSENKVRSFMTDVLGLPTGRTMEIERAHRLKPKNNSVIVKFNRFKDREMVLRRAGEVLGKDSPFYVHADYTARVKRHRRELGKEMIQARDRGQFAAVRYDKLIIDNNIYRYDEGSESKVLIGKQPRKTAISRQKVGISHVKLQPGDQPGKQTTNATPLDERQHGAAASMQIDHVAANHTDSGGGTTDDDTDT